MIDPEVLNSFVGQSVELSPAAGRQAGHRTAKGSQPLVADVVGVTERSQLRLEGTDLRVVELDGRAVHAESMSVSASLRIQGMLEVLAPPVQPAVSVLTPFEHPGAIERRQWARVPAVLPVVIEGSGANDGDQSFRTLSVDLSGGGIKLNGAPDVGVGSWVTLAIELPTGPVEVEAEVLETVCGGATCLRFLRMPESVRSRIVRHVFHVQVEVRRGPRSALR
jgi:PilZ domain